MRHSLFWAAWIYRLVVGIRNMLFNIGVLRSTQFEESVIVIGNIELGGTGKTPHTEYFLNLLGENNFKTASLSRGYGRKTKGFLWVETNSHPTEVGDEPLQMKQKFKDIPFAVCEKRVEGINTIKQKYSDRDVLLLDDAFQHRYVTPSLSVLLTRYERPFYTDYLLPQGNLREPRTAKKRADIFIVTKCPENLSPIEKRVVKSSIKPQANQEVFFSTLQYGVLHSIFDSHKITLDLNYFQAKNTRVIAISGIANPEQFFGKLDTMFTDVIQLQFPDHHWYTDKDIEKILVTYISCKDPNKVIITTEKDAMRFKTEKLKEKLQDLPIFYLPIVVHFEEEEKNKLNQLILNHVRRNKKGQ